MGVPEAYVPEPLARKYPSAGTDLEWQWLCRTKNLVRDPATGLRWRHPVAETGWQVAVEHAARRAGITKKVTPHVLRHSLATEMTRALRPRAPPPPGYAGLRPYRLRPSVVLLGQGTDIRTVQDVWGHQDVKLTEICTHVMKEPGMGVRSPLDEDPAGTEPAT